MLSFQGLHGIIRDVEYMAEIFASELSASAKNLFARASLSEVNRLRIALMTRERNAHANRHADRLPSTIGGMTKLAYARAKAAGIALEPLLRTADLTSHQIETPQTVIRVRDQIKFLNLVAAALKDDLLGFHLAQTADLRELGLLYYLLASSETLIDALHRAERYSSIVNEGVSLRCVDSRFVRISFHCIGIGRHLDTHQIECTMTTVVVPPSTNRI